MIEVIILKIENPDCFWVYITGGRKIVVNEMEYETLQTEMNQFYNKHYQCVDAKPCVLEEGQVCAVYCEELKSWCRAVVNSIISYTDYYIAECFLVDYAKTIPVNTEKICVVIKPFVRLPYRATKFRLYCVKPVTLRVNYYNDNSEIVPANKWDIAAIQYFQNLLNEATQVEAKICAVEEDNFAVYLYVTIKGEKVCVNDALVAKNYACYELEETNQKRDSEGGKSRSEEKNPVRLLWPMLLRESKVSEMGAAPICDNSEIAELTHFPEINLHKPKQPDAVVPVSPLKQGVTFSVPSDMQTVSNLPKTSTKLQERENDLYENNLGVKLLQFLNPDPLKIATEQETEELKLNITTTCLPVVLSNKIEPCSSLETAPLFPALKKELLRKQFQGPNHVQSYSWPAIARGYDSLIISSESDPLSYLLPIITFLQSRNCYISLSPRQGPVALVICPGQRRAELVFEHLKMYSHCSRPLHPMLLFLGMKKEEIKSVRIPRGCEIVVTTPPIFLRLLEHHSLLFLRLCHLVFDEVDVLFSDAKEQILTILQYYKSNLSVEEKEFVPQQIVAVGNHWDKNIEVLTKEFMNDPYIIITSMGEAAIYGKVQQVVQLCLECDRISTLLQTLDFTPTDAQKTLIFTSCVEERDMVYKAVESISIFCLKMNPGIGFHADYIVEQWNKTISPGTHVVLVLTDDCTVAAKFTDATRVIHFSFPPTPRIFGARLHGLSANFQNSVEKSPSLGKEQSKAKSILLLTEKNACHVVGVLNYLERAEAFIPPDLYNFTRGVLEAKEEKRSGQPFCSSIKAYGICKNKNRCPDRHRINLQIDAPSKVAEEALQTGGIITILPLFIVDATNYLGRVVGKWGNLYAALETEMKDYYQESSNCTPVDKVEKLAMYGLREENSFHRVQVLDVEQKEEPGAFYNVDIKYIDEGRTGYVQNQHLLSLPEQFQALPPQAVEFIVCRVKPIDNEAEWHPKVSRCINDKIRGKPHEAKVALVLGNTIWVDPVIRVTKLQDLKTSINEYNIRSEILSTGLGVDNPEHIQELEKLFNEAEIPHEKKEKHALLNPSTDERNEEAEPLEQNVSNPATLSSETSSKEPLPLVQKSQHSQDIIHDGYSQVSLENHCDETVQNKNNEDILQISPKCFHPTIKWFDKQDAVVVKVKLQNISNYNCRIFEQRIAFSASANGKFYLADMELQRSILREESTCVLKGDEPTILLVKVKKEPWCSLLKEKNHHVSFDFDYLDDNEERSPFCIASSPKKVYQIPIGVCEEEEEEEEESSKDSDSESDLSSC
ncbi:putative ATP-dependent RNA helicase TDRD12 [Pseudonaja textilis]|uniref:putative ATP-dependent RNA helicase TDRD12 n=1 Tax=Pseudonaja textilis TaxID=8673 RepID=UPI000EA8E9EC|nr:putative ATP-dependent RNA helicase TDRD12 [Pseudonaja textilis]